MSKKKKELGRWRKVAIDHLSLIACFAQNALEKYVMES